MTFYMILKKLVMKPGEIKEVNQVILSTLKNYWGLTWTGLWAMRSLEIYDMEVLAIAM